MKYQKELDLARRAAREAAEILVRDQHPAILSQVGKDIKLSADKASEAVILDLLQRESKFPVLSEEAGVIGHLDSATAYWVVDPLDGTMNYSRGNVCYCVSLALWVGDDPILGVIVAPALKQEFWGVVGEGSFYNGAPLTLKIVEAKSQAVLTTGFPVQRSYSAEDLQNFITQIRAYKKVRMIGSAALGLAWVSLGQFDVHLEEGNMLWDVAGGLAILRAAGGVVEFTATAKPFCYDVRAATARHLLP